MRIFINLIYYTLLIYGEWKWKILLKFIQSCPVLKYDIRICFATIISKFQSHSKIKHIIEQYPLHSVNYILFIRWIMKPYQCIFIIYYTSCL